MDSYNWLVLVKERRQGELLVIVSLGFHFCFHFMCAALLLNSGFRISTPDSRNLFPTLPH